MIQDELTTQKIPFFTAIRLGRYSIHQGEQEFMESITYSTQHTTTSIAKTFTWHVSVLNQTVSSETHKTIDSNVKNPATDCSHLSHKSDKYQISKSQQQSSAERDSMKVIIYTSTFLGPQFYKTLLTSEPASMALLTEPGEINKLLKRLAVSTLDPLSTLQFLRCSCVFISSHSELVRFIIETANLVNKPHSR